MRIVGWLIQKVLGGRGLEGRGTGKRRFMLGEGQGLKKEGKEVENRGTFLFPFRLARLLPRRWVCEARNHRPHSRYNHLNPHTHHTLPTILLLLEEQWL